MANIVQLEENGQVLYPKTHAKAVDKLNETLIDIFYPVGSIFQSTNSKDPSTIMGGTWERIKGKVLVGVDESDTDFSTVKKTGGAKTHKLTVNELASHSHYGKPKFIQHTQTPGAGAAYGYISDGSYENVASSGGDQPHNNMQPYITVYMWVRTA